MEKNVPNHQPGALKRRLFSALELPMLEKRQATQDQIFVGAGEAPHLQQQGEEPQVKLP